MDNTAAFEAVDGGSIPSGGTGPKLSNFSVDNWGAPKRNCTAVGAKN